MHNIQWNFYTVNDISGKVDNIVIWDILNNVKKYTYCNKIVICLLTTRENTSSLNLFIWKQLLLVYYVSTYNLYCVYKWTVILSMASLENAFTDSADFFSVVFVIVRTRFIWKNILGKSTRNVGRKCGCQKFNSGDICPTRK